MTGLIDIYTDGACSGNPGPGGWGVLVIRNGEDEEICGGEDETTNNRMEMMAAIKALQSLPAGSTARLHTDSTYVKNGITVWVHNWKARGWRTADKKPVKNKDLWLTLEDALEGRSVEWIWVKGHAGDSGNERADELARQGMTPYLA
jgi:ribonuclease HI